MKISLSKRILKYLRLHGGWVNGGYLEKLSMEHGYKGSTGSRNARDLVIDGLVITDYNRDKKHTVWYKAKDPQSVTIYKVQGKEVARVNEW